MRKIPTLFVRDPEDMSRVLPEVHPACGWVMAGEGVATRKYDGTCVMLDLDGEWWARREVKPGKAAPDGWVQVEHDEATGKSVGWEPIGQSSFAKFHAEAIASDEMIPDPIYKPGTYELVGPRINKNPEGMKRHRLLSHADADVWGGVLLTFDGVKAAMSTCRANGVEGLVWHHLDGRMAKIKVRDFQ